MEGRPMNSILKELLHGNLSPVNRQMVRGSEIAHIVNELANAEALLEHAIYFLLLLLKGLIK